jgi:WD40 repeat protein
MCTTHKGILRSNIVSFWPEMKPQILVVSMAEKATIYEFGGFRLDVKQQKLTRSGTVIPLTRKGYQMLSLLVQSSGRVLTKEELMHALWPDSFVEEGNLSQNIFILRKFLGDDRNGSRLIETVPRHGYKFVAPVTMIDGIDSQDNCSAPVWIARFSPDGSQIVTAGDDNSARIWNRTSGQLLANLQGHTERIAEAAFSPDGQLIVTASWDRTAKVWNSVDGRLLVTLSGHLDRVKYAAFSPDGKRIVTASYDKTVGVWNRIDGGLLFILQAHPDQIADVRFSTDGHHIITSSSDHTARIWSSTDGSLLATLQGTISLASQYSREIISNS